jgi:hypothetical protein
MFTAVTYLISPLCYVITTKLLAGVSRCSRHKFKIMLFDKAEKGGNSVVCDFVPILCSILLFHLSTMKADEGSGDWSWRDDMFKIFRYKDSKEDCYI